MATPRLRAEGLARTVDHRTLWSDLSFTLESGQCFVLQGPSGAGKTLLLRTLVGLEQLESGRIECFGDDLASTDIPRLRARMILIPQSVRLSGRTVDDVLQAPFELEVHSSRSWNSADARQLVSRFDRDEAFLAAEIDDLSGGERQIVALIRALLLDPDVLLLDEPTAHLDSATTEAVESIILDWVSDGGAAVWTTHSTDQAERVRRGGSIDLSATGDSSVSTGERDDSDDSGEPEGS